MVPHNTVSSPTQSRITLCGLSTFIQYRFGFSISRCLYCWPNNGHPFLPKGYTDLRVFASLFTLFVRAKAGFRQSTIASRPRAVHIRIHSFNHVKLKRGICGRLAVNIKKLRKPNYLPSDITIEDSITRLTRLTSITALYMVSRPGDQPNVNLLNRRLFARCWTTFGSKLKVLHLTISIELLAGVVDPKLQFPCLEELTINCVMNADDDELCSRRVTPFIQRHHSSLHTLRLNFLNSSADVSAFLVPLASLTHLRHFDLTCLYDCLRDTAFRGLHELLKSCHKTLHSLELCFYSGLQNPSLQEHFSYDCWRVPLPQLKTLTLAAMPAKIDNSLCFYISQFKLTLTTLSLYSALALSAPEVAQLAVALEGLVCLNYLRVQVISLSPWLLITFAKSRPQLKTLHIRHLSARIREWFSEQSDTSSSSSDATSSLVGTSSCLRL